jgi:hypothetical protein
MILEALEQILPAWMLREPRQRVGAVMAGFAATLDALTEAVFEARLAGLPGQLDLPGGNGFDNFDALPLIGRDRRILRGLAEDGFAYAARLREWLEVHARSATPAELLDQLAGILSPNPPLLRITNGSGDWWSRGTDGQTQQLTQRADGFLWNPTTGVVTPQAVAPHEWDWDSGDTNPAPPDRDDPLRFWVVIYAPCNLPYLADDDDTFNDEGVVDDFAADPSTSGAGASPDAGTCGTVAPWKWVELVRTLIAEWRAAGLPCAYVIVTFDPASFNPSTDSTPTSIPDGTWGFDHVPGSGDTTRFPNAEYIPGPPGGIH